MIGCLVVTNDSGHVIGLLSEHDVLQRVALEIPDLDARTVGEVMTQTPETVQENDPIAYALQRMMVGDLRHLPLVDETGTAVGIISSRDVVRYLSELVDVD